MSSLLFIPGVDLFLCLLGCSGSISRGNKVWIRDYIHGMILFWQTTAMIIPHVLSIRYAFSIDRNFEGSLLFNALSWFTSLSLLYFCILFLFVSATSVWNRCTQCRIKKLVVLGTTLFQSPDAIDFLSRLLVPIFSDYAFWLRTNINLKLAFNTDLQCRNRLFGFLAGWRLVFFTVYQFCLQAHEIWE